MRNTAHIGLLTFILLGLICCRQVQHTHQPLVQAEVDADPKMIFLTFSIMSDSAGKTRITLLNKKIAEGKIKAGPHKTADPNRLVITLLNQGRQILSSETIEHPLIKRVEYTTEDNKFERKTLNLKNAEFFVRMKLPSDAQWVAIQEMIDQNEISSVEFNLK